MAQAVSRLRHFKNIEFILGILLAGTMTLLVLLSPLLFPDGGEQINLTARLTKPFTDWAHIALRSWKACSPSSPSAAA